MVTGVLLAAGAGTRYGMPKALAVAGGETFLARGIGVLRAAGLDRVVVVLGAAADEVAATVDLTRVDVVRNPDWATGMGSSLRAGLAALDAETAALVLLVDTPGITPAAVARIAGHAGPAALVAASYHGEQGHPVLLGREHWAGAADSATGDRGARAYLRAHAAELVLVPCDDVADGTDVDTC